jgi:hypothetical protein
VKENATLLKEIDTSILKIDTEPESLRLFFAKGTPD